MPVLEDGQLFERYRVHKWLGSGVAGESYEAEDRILQRKVTLKLIHPWAALPDSARRQFFREMQGISLLNHPYLATVLDYGEIEGRMYVARRYVSSGSLLGTNGRLWFHPPLLVADAFKYAHQLAQALQYIHQHGYLHGSFTFANVLVLRGPNAEHDTDYAPFLMADVGLTNFVRRFGHPRIETLPVSAAPEQLGKRVTPSSDQFALAVLLYFWLAGRPPYLGTASEVEQQKLSETITPLNLLNPGVTREQDSIILRALTVYPEDRYPSVLAFTEELLASLASANSPYAPFLAPQAATPPHPNGAQETVADAETQTEPTPHTQTSAAEAEKQASATDIEKIADVTPLSQAQTEPYHSALEELLALPQTRTDNVSFGKKADQAPIEQNAESKNEASIEREQQEPFALFPDLPETPPVEELPAQAELAFILSEASIEQPPSKQTGPLAVEPDVAALDSQTDEPARAMPLELPDSADFFSLDELSQRQEDEPDDSPSIDEEEIPTVPRGEFVSDEEEIPTVPRGELAISEEEIPTVPRGELAISEEGLVTYSVEEFSSFSELVSPIIFPDEPLLSRQENTPPVPLGEPAASAPENTALAETSTPVTPQPAAFQSEEDASALAEQARTLQEDTHALAEQTDAFEEDARSLSEQAKVLQEDTHALAKQTDAFEKDARSLSEQANTQTEAQPTSEEDAPSILPEELATAATESVTPLASDEPALPDEVRPLAAEQAESVTIDEPEQPQLAATSSIPSASMLEMECVPQPQGDAPILEAPETSSTTYPPIDEAIIAPRLLISSPYTSSSYEFLLIDEETNIGRAGASNLYLEEDNLTSRHHALLKRVGERALIFDKRSHNGVFLNGQKIEVGRGYELADGDHIGIGNYELIFRSAPAGHVSQLI